MKFKYYAQVPNLKEAVELYADIFSADIIKPYKEGNGHAYVKAFGEISIMLWGREQAGPKPGYYIFRFDKNEKQMYLDACERVRENPVLNVGIDNSSARWGTTFFEFTDPYGYTWDFEIDTDVLEQ